MRLFLCLYQRLKSKACQGCNMYAFSALSKTPCTISSWACLPAGFPATITHNYSTQPRCLSGFYVRLFKRYVPLNTWVCLSFSIAIPSKKNACSWPNVCSELPFKFTKRCLPMIHGHISLFLVFTKKLLSYLVCLLTCSRSALLCSALLK